MTDARIPPDALEGLMKKVFLDRQHAPGLFWDAVLKANLYIPLAKTTAEGESEKSETLVEQPIQLGLGASGKKVLWLFTSPEVMADYTERKMPYVEKDGADVFQKIKDVEFEVVLIGPGGLTLSLDPKLVESLAAGKVPQPAEETVRNIAKDARVKVSEIEGDTAELEAAFRELFGGMPNVREAAFIQISDEAGSRLLLGLSLSEDNRSELRRAAEQVAKAAEGVLAPGKTIDITLIGGSLRDAFTKFGRTFYKKDDDAEK